MNVLLDLLVVSVSHISEKSLYDYVATQATLNNLFTTHPCVLLLVITCTVHHETRNILRAHTKNVLRIQMIGAYCTGIIL